jgi:hypothetical protein
MKLLLILIVIWAVFLIWFIFFQGTAVNDEAKESEINDVTEESDNVSQAFQTPINACESLCNAALDSGKSLYAGPCLSEAASDWVPNWHISGWACDVAHNPRDSVDIIPANQCHGNFNHFVEVNITCGLIRAV